jgi:UDP-N-acetylmuramate--alanine ligase
VTELKTIHFIGIGGVGMSGIALVAKARGITVSGSDMKESRATRKLAEAGIEVFIGHDAANVPQDCDVVVVSSAIPEKNPELVEAHRRGISVWHRSQMLAELGKGRKTLACAGTHGKTTSSSMLATTIDRMGLDPSFLIGGTVDGYDTNAKNGTGEYYIVEADESDGSFVHLSPYVALITNVEADHLDHYGTLDAIYDAFGDFMGLVPDEGAVVVCADNPRLVELARSTGKRTIPYGEKGTPGAEAVFTVKGRDGLGYAFTVEFPDGQSADVSIRKNPGRHNVLNATGVLSVVWACGLDIQKGAEALSTFSGVRRRFDLVGEEDGVTVVDDYAHHPTEIKATIKARLAARLQARPRALPAASLHAHAVACADVRRCLRAGRFDHGHGRLPGRGGADSGCERQDGRALASRARRAPAGRLDAAPSGDRAVSDQQALEGRPAHHDGRRRRDHDGSARLPGAGKEGVGGT